MSKDAKPRRRRREVVIAVAVDPIPAGAEQQLVDQLARFLIAITRPDKPSPSTTPD